MFAFEAPTRPAKAHGLAERDDNRLGAPAIGQGFLAVLSARIGGCSGVVESSNARVLPSRLMSGPRSSIELRAPAKLNLSLAVGPPVPPKGYHPIASWFVPISLFDEVTLTALPEGAATVHDLSWHDGRAIDWPVEKDLAVRAHRALELEAGRALPVRLTVRKRIPTGGGLGGGSSDAAATLVGVNRLFRLGLGHCSLARIAEGLGSDVSYFLDDRLVGVERDSAGAVGLVPRQAWVTGFGERVRRLDAGVSTEVVLVFPALACPTAEVYRAFDGLVGERVGGGEGGVGGVPGETEAERVCASACRHGRIDPALLRNDLTEAAYRAVPPLRALVVTRLEPALASMTARFGTLRACMSGSGSTLFVLPPQSASAAELAGRIARAVPEVRTMCARILRRRAADARALR